MKTDKNDKNLSATQIENAVSSVRGTIRHLATMRPTPAMKLRAVIAGSLTVLERLELIDQKESMEIAAEADAAHEEGKKAWKAKREK